MSSANLIVLASILAGMILFPLLVLGLVRWLIPAEEPVEDMVEISTETAPSTLGDFWDGLKPHLLELRDRLVNACIAIGIGASFGFYLVNNPVFFGVTLPDFMVQQLAPAGTVLKAVMVGEIFLRYMNIALTVGIIIAMPMIIYQLVAFFSPGLLNSEKRIVYTALPIVTELFLAGIVFGWFITIPAALGFLLGYGNTATIQTEPTADSFFDTVSTLLLWNGIIFELPAIMYLLARLNIVSTKMLTSTRRYAIVIITIIAALITPTGDPYNLMLLALPMYLLYELGILLTRLVPRPSTV
ncbi:MAG: twin-arginine translocase subunit TatC [Chloroflexi bacterium]|nr:MAG: twin-arginine translocase subunit TatC [Chloroflexota bacterium]